MRWVPFVATFKLFPAHPGSRFENRRELERIGRWLYSALSLAPQLQLALPGGGQARPDDNLVSNQFSNMSNACAVKPGFGNTPPQAMVAGFYSTTPSPDSLVGTDNVQPWPLMQLICCNNVSTGNRANRSISTPSPSIDAEVKALRALMEANINATIPATITYTTWKIDYAGILYGDRGFTFPR